MYLNKLLLKLENTGKGFKGTVANRALRSLHIGSFKTRLTVTLIDQKMCLAVGSNLNQTPKSTLQTRNCPLQTNITHSNF